jgi:hypothetical protein
MGLPVQARLSPPPYKERGCLMKDQIKEVFMVNPFQGAAATLVNISKKGYQVAKINRNENGKTIVTFQKIKREKS